MKYYFVFFVSIVSLQSCKSQEKKEPLVEASMIRTSLRAMGFIKSHDYENLMFMVPKDLKKAFPPDKVKIFVDEASNIISREGIPTGNKVQARITLRTNGRDTIVLNTIAFEYPNAKNPKLYKEIVIGFIQQYGDKRPISFDIQTNPQDAGNMKLKIQPVSELLLHTNDVINYRVYYNQGKPATTLFGKHKGVFVLEGDAKTFTTSGLKAVSESLFSELGKTKLQNPERFNSRLNYDEDGTEFIQAEFIISNLDYGVFIYLPIKNTGVQGDKIIVRQLQFANFGYQYTISKKENPRLVEILQSIAAKNWGSYYADNP